MNRFAKKITVAVLITYAIYREIVKSKVNTMTQAIDVLKRGKGDNPGIGHSLIDYFEEVVKMVCHFINSQSLKKQTQNNSSFK